MKVLISRGLEGASSSDCQHSISPCAYPIYKSTNPLLAPLFQQQSLQNSQSTNPADLRYQPRDFQSKYKNK